MNQGEKCTKCGAFVPMIENGAKRLLAPENGDGGAEDDRHPEQSFEASSETDAAKRGKGREQGGAHGKARDHPRRAQGLRYVRRLRQGANLGSAEILAAQRFVERIQRGPHRGNAGPRHLHGQSLHLDEGRQQSEREVGMVRLDCGVEPIRQFTLA